MAQAPIHYELYIRRVPGAPWTLSLATEDRAIALATAESLLLERQAAAVRVTKETMDSETLGFRTSTILAKGEVDVKAKKVRAEDQAPLCVSPSDLYSMHSRDRITRLLEEWLNRNGITAFELLHRADMAELLEGSGMDLQGAIQKISIPESQSRGLSVHEVVRSFQGLTERTLERIRTDHKKGRFPDPNTEGFAQAAVRLYSQPDPSYLLGGGVAAHLAPARNWKQKVDGLLDLADKISGAAIPMADGPKALAFKVLEQPLSEILGSKKGLADLLGANLNLGQRLAAMTRLAAPKAVDDLILIDPAMAKSLPPLQGPAVRLAQWLGHEAFFAVRASIARQILRDLLGPRRLCPDNAAQEVEMLRALAMALTFGAGKLMTAEDVQAAFVDRSRMLMSTEFVTAYVGNDRTAFEEAEALIRLLENVIGAANKREAARWIRSNIGALKFERDVIGQIQPPRTKLQTLARMQRSITKAGLTPEDTDPILKRIGEVGGLVEAESKYIATIMKAQVTPSNRLMVLLALAAGDAGPSGPVSDRAKAEAMKLLRQPEVRKDLAASPETAAAVKRFLEGAASIQAPSHS
ncbi:MAG: hypothetical protein RJA87_224 [Pseudomonadota bacterium]|jgi:hypothetical protein